MAVETQNPEAAPPAAEEVVVVEKSLPPAPEPEKPAPVEAEKPKAEAEVEIAQSISFKEESNVAGELPESQKKALEELKVLIQEALNKRQFTTPAAKEEVKAAEEEKKEETLAQPAEEAKAEVSEKVVEIEIEAKEEEKIKPAPEAAAAETVVVETETAAIVVDEDGAKTVEAIEETVVASAPAEEPKKEEETVTVPPLEPEEVSIWGIPLLADERSDVILLKFLRARDFKVKEAFTMIQNTVRWRKEFGIDALLEEDLGNELEKAVFMNGFDKEGHPICYNVYGVFQNKELYQNSFSDEEKRLKFLKWRIQFLEKSIRKLDFSPTGINTIVQIVDLKNAPGPGKRELKQVTNQALQLLQDNYPEFVAKQVLINVPWWYLAFNTLISPFMTQRSKSKFVFSSPARSADTLFKYIAPEQVPVQYGGLNKEGEQEFTTLDSITEFIIKPSSKHTIEFPVSEKSQLVWELRVLGWDVSYGAEFVPTAEDGYTVIVSKTRKVSTADEPVISDSFKVGEPGKIVLTINNQSSKKKKLVYRSKTKPCSD